MFFGRFEPVLVALVVFSMGPLMATAQDAAPVVRIEGTVVDTHKGMVIPGDFHPPHFTINEVTVQLESYESESDEPLHPFIISLLRKNKNRVRCELPYDGNAIKVLKKHRKPFGAGIKGPLTVTGKVRMYYGALVDGTMDFSATLVLKELKGPKGSYENPFFEPLPPYGGR